MHIQDLNKVNNILKLDINEVCLRQLVQQLWTATGLWLKMSFEAVFNVVNVSLTKHVIHNGQRPGFPCYILATSIERPPSLSARRRSR